MALQLTGVGRAEGRDQDLKMKVAFRSASALQLS